jgi:hypothetical protein
MPDFNEDHAEPFFATLDTVCHKDPGGPDDCTRLRRILRPGELPRHVCSDVERASVSAFMESPLSGPLRLSRVFRFLASCYGSVSVVTFLDRDHGTSAQSLPTGFPPRFSYGPS